MNKPTLDMSSVFGKALPLGGLYCGVVLQQRLDLMEHLLEFGRQLILLSGEKGAGKTTLLQTISEKTSERWQCIFLEAGPQLGAEALLSRVADELDIGKRRHDEIRLDDDDAEEIEPPSGSELLAAVRQRITELDRSGMMVVIILDDADQLLVETVGALLQLARTEEPLAEARARYVSVGVGEPTAYRRP
jgi:type II secretory pathway predicted ATPase ExeA